MDFVQAWITLTGVAAIWLVNTRNDKLRRWGPVFGLISQPAWFIATYSAGQWGMLGLSCFYTYAWIMGIRNHWFAPLDKPAS